MASVRSAIREAMRLLKALAPGDDPTADELAAGLEGAQSLLLALHEARGPMRTLDIGSGVAPGAGAGEITTLGGLTLETEGGEPLETLGGGGGGGGGAAIAVCPGENQRLRIQAGTDVTVTLPNAVSMGGADARFDYGFAWSGEGAPQIGTTGPADGVQWRAPTDGARIEIVGTSQALYLYREDVNAWMAATDLTLDSELPLNARYQSDFAVLLAERLADVLSNLPEPTRAQGARIAASREALFTRPGVRRPSVAAEYF